VWRLQYGVPEAVTPRQIDLLIDRLDAHSAKLDEVRSDLDRIKGGMIGAAALMFSVLVPIIAVLLSK